MKEGKKKEGFFKKIKKDSRLQVMFSMVSVAILLILYIPLSVYVKNSVDNGKALKQDITKSDYVLTDVAGVKTVGEKYELFGWTICLGAEVQKATTILAPINDFESSDEIVLKTTLGEDSTVLGYLEYLQDKSASGSGFIAEVEKEKLQKDTCYELLVYVEYEHMERHSVKVSSKKYLYNGQVYTYNPLVFSAPVFTDEQMSQVVENGYLLGYATECGAWVYQHECNLYLIVDKRIEKNLDEYSYMVFHLNTSVQGLLPEERRQYGFDNKDFVFYTRELQFDNEIDYRVAVLDIPTNYPVTYITIGHYDVHQGVGLWEIRNKIMVYNSLQAKR